MTGRSRTVETYDRLRSQLLDGSFAPGSKLKIDALCARFEVSPGAVREALARLVSEGMVISEPQRGFSVARISTAELIDLTAVRIEVETKCLRRSIEHGDLAWEGHIKNVWHQLQNTPMFLDKENGVVNPRWTDLHCAFHDSLIAACDSQWWLKLRDQMFLHVERYRRMLLPFAKVPRDTDAEHAAIADAVLARDTSGACKLLTKHLQLTADMLLESDAPFSDRGPMSEATTRNPKEMTGT